MFPTRTYWERSAQKIKAADGVGRFDLFANFTCSFCNSSRRMRSWRLSPACPTAPWSFRSPRKTVCRLLWIWCFPCSLLLGGRPVFRLLPVEGSMPHPVELYTLIRGGIIPPHPLARVLHPRATFRRQTFISAAPAMKRRLHSSCSPHFVIAGALSPYMPLKVRKNPSGSAP